MRNRLLRVVGKYRIMQGSNCLFESQDIAEVIKFIQELNFEASLLLLILRTEELKLTGRR